MLRELEFKKYVEKIFEEADYLVQTEVNASRFMRVDICAIKDNQKYGIEIKCSEIRDETLEKINSIAGECAMTPVVVTSQVIKESKREEWRVKYPNVELVDIANILYAVKSRDDLYTELVAGLSYVIDDIEPKKGLIEIESFQHSNAIKGLINELKMCISGRQMFREYEEICGEMLKYIFPEELALWKKQQKSNNNLYRFDLLCRIKDGNQRTFWSILERYFNSKYIIFEFKNYEDPITQREVYTTEKYLYAKALRSVAIVIAQNGYDENAAWAAKGCLRENGKLIILLSTDDLIQMGELKVRQENPSDYLLERLDKILLELEK